MKVKLITLGVVLSLVMAAIPVGWTTQVLADDEEQPTKEQKIISPLIERYLASLNPTDNISIIVRLKNDPQIDQQIHTIMGGQPGDEWDRITEGLRQKYRSVPMAKRPLEEQLLEGNPAAMERYQQLLVEYGLTQSYVKAQIERLEELSLDKAKQEYSVLEQAYSNMQQVKDGIEHLPDTKVTGWLPPYNYYGIRNFRQVNLVIKTKVANINTIAAIPDVEQIYVGNAWIFFDGQFCAIPLYPINGSLSYPADQPLFCWSSLSSLGEKEK